jgi:feruloyl esterase
MGGVRNPRTGRQIFAGWFASAAAAPGSWSLWITGPAVPGASIQAFFGNAYFGRIIHEIPAPGIWDFSTFNFDSDMKSADQKPVGGSVTMNAVDPELGDFRRANHRGKIIHWHGWEDPAISAISSVDYYNEVVAANGDSREFYRLFLAPGMLHCGGGPGPNSFGQSLPQATPLDNSPENDILSALERWVEHGVAPKRIVAVKYRNDNPAQGVLRTRPLCAYPRTAVYRGSGSTDEAANFDCRKPARDGGDDGDND